MSRTIMTVDEAVHVMAHESAIKLRQVAGEIGMPESTLSRKLSMYDEGAHLEIEKAVPVMRGFKSTLPLQVMCRLMGGMFVKLPVGKARNAPDIPGFQASFANLTGLLFDFFMDPQPDKVQPTRDAINAHLQSTVDLRASIKHDVNQLDMEFGDAA